MGSQARVARSKLAAGQHGGPGVLLTLAGLLALGFVLHGGRGR
jgi:hypothetical protein